MKLQLLLKLHIVQLNYPSIERLKFTLILHVILIIFIHYFSEVNGDGKFQPILKSCALEEVPPNLILSFKNRIITVSIFSIHNNNKSKQNVFIRYQIIV